MGKRVRVSVSGADAAPINRSRAEALGHHAGELSSSGVDGDRVVEEHGAGDRGEVVHEEGARRRARGAVDCGIRGARAASKGGADPQQRQEADGESTSGLRVEPH